MNKIVIIFIIMLVASVATIGAISTKLTTVSVGKDGETLPRYIYIGFFEIGKTIYLGEKYGLKLNNGTFIGWFISPYGYKYHINGTYLVEGRLISGTWRIGQMTGWISGMLGI